MTPSCPEETTYAAAPESWMHCEGGWGYNRYYATNCWYVTWPNRRMTDRFRKAISKLTALPDVSGVNVRNIQLYEQRVQDINNASASTLAALARSLSCRIEDLME